MAKNLQLLAFSSTLMRSSLRLMDSILLSFLKTLSSTLRLPSLPLGCHCLNAQICRMACARSCPPIARVRTEGGVDEGSSSSLASVHGIRFDHLETSMKNISRVISQSFQSPVFVRLPRRKCEVGFKISISVTRECNAMNRDTSPAQLGIVAWTRKLGQSW